MKINNPYLYHPHPLCVAAADDLRKIISSNPDWEREFAKGKMLGVLVVEGRREIHALNDEYSFIAAYSGIVDIKELTPNDGTNGVFVPSVYDLSKPGDFYREEEARISEINSEIVALSDSSNNSSILKEAGLSNRIAELKAERKRRSQALQLEIFRHFDFVNHQGEKKNILGIFADAKRGLPPGGAGECAAPRLLQYAFAHGLKPVAIAEFWYGISPKQEPRVHGQFYPSCIEKCSPLLKFMLGEELDNSLAQPNHPKLPIIIFEDSDIIVLDKPAETLSVPGKDTEIFNVETWLHETHPDVRGPMLVHRLDQSTSGLMIAAKNATAFKTLQQGFLDHSIRKTYLAWLDGDVPSECGVVSLPICSNPDDRPRQIVDKQFGKVAVTRFRVLRKIVAENSLHENESEKKACRTLLALYPLTGRTHQLRLHCASPFGLDCPMVGDRIYNLEHSEGKLPVWEELTASDGLLQLRAAEITFPHPVTKEILHFKI